MNNTIKTLNKLSLIGLIVTIALTCGIGGTITSAEVGMAYPTWPNINSGSLFSFFYDELATSFGVGSVVEHTHRQAASLTGLIILILACYAFAKRATINADLRKLAYSSLILVIAQGLLGATRVFENDYIIAILHAVGAQIVVAILAILYLKTKANYSEHFPLASERTHQKLIRWSRLTMFLLIVNLFAAASLRHKQGAFEGHLILAILTTTALCYLIYLISTLAENRVMFSHAQRLSKILGTQVALGVGAWAFLLGPLAYKIESEDTRFLIQAVIATGHLLCGVLLFAYATVVYHEIHNRLKK